MTTNTVHLGALGYEVESSGHGYSRLKLQAEEGHCNRNGKLLGAALYGLVEASMMSAAKTVLDGQAAQLTDIELRLLRSMGQGAIYCETKVLSSTKIHMVLETNVVNEDSIVCARASGAFYLREK